MGKTSLATNIAYNVARSYKKGVMKDGTEGSVNGGVIGFFSLEMSAEQLAARILSEAAEIPSENIFLPSSSSPSPPEAKGVVFKPENKQPTVLKDEASITLSLNPDYVTKSRAENPSLKHKICFCVNNRRASFYRDFPPAEAQYQPYLHPLFVCVIEKL